THEPHLPGEAEVAVHRAADLAGDAEGLPGRVGDVNSLDAPTVLELEEELPRAVGRSVFVGQPWRADAKAFRQLRAQIAAKVGHGGKVRHAVLVDPGEHLPGAEPRK